MELYILDSLLRRTRIFDNLDSLIWTERWRDVGEFELDLGSTLDTRSSFQPGVMLGMSLSHRIMVVETVENTKDEEGNQTLKVKGSSLESILKDRTYKASLSADSTEIITGLPSDVADLIFDRVCRNGDLDSGDVIPYLQPGSFLPQGNIPFYSTSIRWEQRPASVHSALVQLCDIYDMGFRLVKEYDLSKLYFDVYTGDDRTSEQSILEPVVFSEDLNNLRESRELRSIKNAKNVAYVFSDVGHAVVYADGVDPSISGFDRRVLVVTMSVPNGSPDPSGDMVRAGQDALQNARAIDIFDGEVDQRASYIYGTDYGLGDRVEFRNEDGIISYKRVTEQIFVLDEEGERSYPTLADGATFGVSDWLSFTNDPTQWIDFTTEEWVDL